MAFGISAMILMHRCADATPIPLVSGLLVSFTLAVVHVALFLLGMLLGNYFHFTDVVDPDAFAKSNALVFLGFAVVVAVKQLLPYLGRKTKPVAFDLNAGTSRVLLFTVATGINGFLLGMGVGFVAMLDGSLHKAFWPLFLFTLLFSYLGVMFGRQHVHLRPRRWMAVSTVVIIATAVVAVIAAG
jgi:putative Mn2+ efflux pump MntP